MNIDDKVRIIYKLRRFQYEIINWITKCNPNEDTKMKLRDLWVNIDDLRNEFENDVIGNVDSIAKHFEQLQLKGFEYD